MASGKDLLKAALPGLALSVLGLGVAAIGGLAFNSAAAVEIGAILTVSGFGVSGAGIISGALTKSVRTPDLETDSPSWGFGQWSNPYKGDSAIPIIYSVEGVKMAPVYTQAYLTPRGDYEDDAGKALRADGQQLTALFAVGEGPIGDIKDPRVEDEPLFETFEAKLTGNGSKTKFTLDRKRIEISSLAVTVDGTSKGWSTADVTWDYRHRGATAVVTKSVEFDDLVAQHLSPTIKVNGVEIDTTLSTGLRPRVWLETPAKAWIHSQEEVSSGTRIQVTFKVLRMDGVDPRTKDGETALHFDTAPSSGAKIVVTGRRRIMKGVRVEHRLGGEHQLPLVGVEAVRNTRGVSAEIGLSGNEVTFDTQDEVDDVVLNIASAAGGMTAFDKEGNRSRTYAQFIVDYEKADESGSYAGSWTRLLDPAGKVSAKNSPVGVPKNATEFEVRDDKLSQAFWSFSTRGLLEKYVEKFPNNSGGKARLSAYTRGRYRYRLRRSSSIKNDTNSRYLDRIYLQSFNEVIDERLSYPGTAMMKLSALGSERINGSAPRVTCNPIGIQDAKTWNGSAWGESATAQGNPVWASIDLITKRRYGGGDRYTHANIDTTSALAAATHCDASEDLPGGGSETRAVLDAVLDIQRPLLEVVHDMLRPAGIWPVLQGHTWKFVIDQAVDLTSVPVIYEDGADRDVISDTFEIGNDSAEEKATEIRSTFLDRDRDFDQKQVWAVPSTPAESRVIKAIQVFGASRRTQVTRYTNRVYTQIALGGPSIRFKLKAGHMGREAGDVFRFVSSRLGIDGYWRVFRLALDTTDYFPSVEAIPYVPQTYGQQEAAQSTLATSQPDVSAEVGVSGPGRRSGSGSTGSGATTRRRVGRMKMTVRRAG